MKKPLKKVLIYLLIFIATELLIYLVGTGFIRNRYVAVTDYSVSENGQQMTLTVSVPASIGYVRKVKTHRNGAELCLDFYSAFGGMNGKIGARSSYTVELDDSVSVISVYRGDSGYEYVLVRGYDGTWNKMQ